MDICRQCNIKLKTLNYLLTDYYFEIFLAILLYFRCTGTRMTKFPLLLYLCIYLPGDDLEKVETCS
jgi:hypothetical protein